MSEYLRFLWRRFRRYPWRYEEIDEDCYYTGLILYFWFFMVGCGVVTVPMPWGGIGWQYGHGPSMLYLYFNDWRKFPMRIIFGRTAKRLLNEGRFAAHH